MPILTLSDKNASAQSTKRKQLKLNGGYVAIDAEWQDVPAEIIELLKAGYKPDGYFPVVKGTVPAVLTYYYKSQKGVIINEAAIREGKRNELVAIAKLHAHFVDVLSFGCHQAPLLTVLHKRFRPFARYTLLHFYSFKDVELALGWANSAAAIMQESKAGRIEKKRCITGRVMVEGVRFDILDTKGCAQGSLADWAASTGFDASWKEAAGTLPLDKTRMVDEMNNRPEVFFPYALSDAEILPALFKRHCDLLNELMNMVGIPESEYYHYETGEGKRGGLGSGRVGNFPRTVGAQVEGIMARYIRNYVSGPYAQVWKYCLCKLGRLNEEHHQRDQVRAALDWVKAEYKARRRKSGVSELDLMAGLLDETLTLPKGKNGIETKSTIEFITQWSAYEFLSYSQAGVQEFARYIDTSGVFNALVLGGRCRRERQDEYRFEWVLDADFKGAYAEVLRRIQYPLGLPRVYATTEQEKPKKLGWFIKTVKPKCTGNWQVLVKGNLPDGVRQDLIYGKDSTARQIHDHILEGGLDRYLGITENEDSDKHADITQIPGKFLMLKDGVVNGVITPELWEAIEKAGNSREMRAFYDLEIVTAAYYLEDDSCETPEEWMSSVVNDEGIFGSENGRVDDTRTLKNFHVPFEGLFGITADRRNNLKAEAKGLAQSDPDKTIRLNALQNTLKLFNNAGYGVLASPYFPIGNTVIANKITGTIRRAAWMLTKACDCTNLITDGGAYQPMQIWDLFGGRLPSLTVLSDRQNMAKHRSLRRKSLNASVSFPAVIQDAFDKGEVPDFAQPRKLTSDEADFYGHSQASDIDLWATQHVREFWSRYGLEPDFSIEHKEKHCAVVWACLGRSDYAGLCAGYGEPVLYSIRGVRNHGEDGFKKRSPKFDILKNILDGVDEIPENFDYYHSFLNSPGNFRYMNPQLLGDNFDPDAPINGAKPGDELANIRRLRLNNDWADKPDDSQKTEYETQKMKRKRSARKRKNDEGRAVAVSMFEKYRNEGYAKLHKRMLNDRLPTEPNRNS